MLDGDVEGAVNLGSGTPVALKTIVREIGRQLGRPDLIELGAIPARANDTPFVVADVARLRSRGRLAAAHRARRGHRTDDRLGGATPVAEAVS